MPEELMGFIQGSAWIIFAVVVAIALAFYAKARYKVPSAGAALVITGGKKMRVLPGGGAFVSPLRKHQFFPLKVMTVQSEDQETQTRTLVPVVVRWTAQLRADIETEGALDRAVTGFADYEVGEISNSLQRTLDGEVRAVVATMTPEEVVQDKESFSAKVESGVRQRMEELGFKLVSLNIADVMDRNNHYHNLAAEDRETRRREAETLTAQANEHVAVEQARSDEASQTAALVRDLNVAEKNREVILRRAAIQAETDIAQADAEIAGRIQTELRNQDLAAREGEVAVVREQQREAAARARRDVEVTEAQTDKEREVIAAESKARQREIDAEAAANVAKAAAHGAADARVVEAEGEADAISKTTEARTHEIRQTGLAEAEVARAKGEAEAAATLAKGAADAEVQRKMAEALAANDGANLRVTLAEIQRDTTISIYTNVGKAMGRIGEHATFIDMGGSSSSGDGDLLSNVLGHLPELMKKLDVKSEALNGAPFGDLVGSLVKSVSGKSATDDPEVHGSDESSDDQSAEAPLWEGELSGSTSLSSQQDDELDASDPDDGSVPADSILDDNVEK